MGVALTLARLKRYQQLVEIKEEKNKFYVKDTTYSTYFKEQCQTDFCFTTLVTVDLNALPAFVEEGHKAVAFLYALLPNNDTKAIKSLIRKMVCIFEMRRFSQKLARLSTKQKALTK